jgi:hypothetical protein
MASYTFSKLLTNNLGYYGSAGVAAEGAYWVNAYDEEANYGRGFFDARHNFVLATNYELPFGQDKHWGSNWSGLPEALFGGWKMSAIFQVRSGFPSRSRTPTGGRSRARAARSGRIASATPCPPTRASRPIPTLPPIRSG